MQERGILATGERIDKEEACHKGGTDGKYDRKSTRLNSSHDSGTVRAKMEELESIDVSETYINREEKRLTDYTPRELLKALYDLGYEGTFYTYVRQENTLSHLFGDGKNK